MKVKTRTIYMLAAILVMIVSAYLFDEWYRFSQNTSLLRKEHITLVDKFYKGIGKRSNAILKSEANLILQNHHAFAALEAGNRDDLLVTMKPYLVYMEAIFPGSPITMNFFLPNGNAFLRVQDPKRFGDNHIDRRPILKAVLEKRKPAFGLETCGTTLSHRLVQPLFHENKFLGILELGIDLSFIANRVTSISDMRNIILVNSNAAKVLQCTVNGVMNPEYFNNTTIPVENLFADKDNGIVRRLIKSKGINYEIVKDYNLVDFSGVNIGKIIFITKTSGLEEWFKAHILRAVIICVIGVILIVWVARRGFIQSIEELEQEHTKAIKEIKDINAHLEERVQHEVDNCRVKDQIINQQQKVADMGLMLSALAHHWRQPINAVGLYVQDLSEAYKSGELNIEYINDFEKNNMGLLNKLSDSIDRYRTFFEPSVSKTEFEVIGVLSEIGDMLNASLSSSSVQLTVKCKCDKKEMDCHILEKMPVCEFKGTRINGFLNEFKQTLLNMIYNSIDAINERYEQQGTHVKDGMISINLVVDESTIKIEITDNGIGIPEDIIDKVFNPFFTTKEEGKGTGIGLYMAKTVIEKYMCGTLTAKNTGSGTTMEIILHKDTDCS